MRKTYIIYIKTPLDTLLSIVIFIAFFPIFLFLLVSLFYAYKSVNVFFSQQRSGKNGKIFSLIKFKTMSERFDEMGNILPDAERLTAFGKFLRSTSLDELPQLINVLRGDMSLVGPRPFVTKYMDLYNERQTRRHELKPGITGWAQINGRNALSWKEKFEMDVWYVENVSLRLDLKILWITFYKVMKKEGINAAGSTTGVPFSGNQL